MPHILGASSAQHRSGLVARVLKVRAAIRLGHVDGNIVTLWIKSSITLEHKTPEEKWNGSNSMPHKTNKKPPKGHVSVAPKQVPTLGLLPEHFLGICCHHLRPRWVPFLCLHLEGFEGKVIKILRETKTKFKNDFLYSETRGKISHLQLSATFSEAPNSLTLAALFTSASVPQQSRYSGMKI